MLILNCIFVLSLVVLVSIFLIRLILKIRIKQCTSNANMHGKVVIVTGGNTGLGYHTAEDLARRGARVILACRDDAKGTTAKYDIITSTGNSKVHYRHLNLSSLKSIREFADNINKTEEKLHVLVNNAGVHGHSSSVTEDGIIEGMQINYFGPFLLTLLLLPLLKKSKGRVVNLSSILHFLGKIDVNKLGTVGAYNDNQVYNNSKLCILMFTVELAKRVKTSELTANAVHPGIIQTGIVSHSSCLTQIVFRLWTWISARTPEDGAQTIIHLAVAEELENVSGKYFADCEQRKTSRYVHDEELRQKLWNYSEKIVGLV